ncbi:hypothetical protein V2J09_003134 [Rumex salicifolius]
MAGSQSCSRMLNPWVLHLQKLGLELKCPSCLELYNKPNLLPCDHLFCGSCVPDANSASGSECAICKRPFHMKDVRQAPYMESIVNIYRSLDLTFSSRIHQMAFVKGSSSPLPPSSKTKLKQDGQDEAINLNVYQLNQLSPFGVNSSDPGSGDDSLLESPVKKSNKRLADEFTSDEVHCSTNPIGDNSKKIAKKSKQKLNGKGDALDQMAESGTDMVDCGEKVKLETKLSPGTHPIHSSISMDSLPFVCGFCQTSKVTEHTGPMMHYAGRNPVVGIEATRPGVLHVHSRCTEWTPQVYYIDETVNNLKKELQRGAKLKCCKCNLKGAALGCYARSCKRTYHVPCAAEISECRWDTNKYLMLCPAHASFKFPCEKAKKRVTEKPVISLDIAAQKEMEHICFWATSPTGAKNWAFCPSSLSINEKNMLTDLANLCGATVSKHYSSTVTHIIAGTDETGAYTRTKKVLMAILEGKWILSIDWIKACLEMKAPEEEEDYEINIDNHGCLDGPKTGRMRADVKADKLFSGLNFYFPGESTFVSAFLDDLQDLIRAAGGTLLESKSMLEASVSFMIVYNCDSDAETGSENDSEVLQRQLEAEVLAAETGSHAIPHTWVLKAIASCSLLPLGFFFSRNLALSSNALRAWSCIISRIFSLVITYYAGKFCIQSLWPKLSKRKGLIDLSTSTVHNSCVPNLDSASGSECAVCMSSFLVKDVRQAPFMESIVNIYLGSSNFLPSSYQTKMKQERQNEAKDLNVYQLYKLSLSIRVKNSNPGSGNDMLKRHHVRKSNKRLADEFTTNKVHCSTTPLAYDSTKKIKKLKLKFSHGFVCGFCGASKVTLDSGPMLHYADGNLVAGSEITSPDDIHNINNELERGAKLNCCKCKLRVAALGCYEKSCKRTYHVPCAAEISGCRWDKDKVHMLCPAHASLEFPSEKSGKHISEKHTSEKLDANPDISWLTHTINFWAASPFGAKKWVFCASSLSFMYILGIFTRVVLLLWAIDPQPSPMSLLQLMQYTRTREVFMAILKGKWVLSIDWVKTCIKMKGPVNEEPYEINLDNHGLENGPRTGRMRAIFDQITPKLFSGMKFFFLGEFDHGWLLEFKDLIREAGGIVFENKSMLRQGNWVAPEFTYMIVYNCDSKTDECVSLKRQREAEALAAETCSNAMSHLWIVNSIASGRQQPFEFNI